MKRTYFAPLCEEIKVSATSELLAGSAGPATLSLQVTTASNVHAE